jgi:hypothetical protein
VSAWIEQTLAREGWVIAAQQKPDHATIARFRVRHENALAELFGSVLLLCRLSVMPARSAPWTPTSNVYKPRHTSRQDRPAWHNHSAKESSHSCNRTAIHTHHQKPTDSTHRPTNVRKMRVSNP